MVARLHGVDLYWDFCQFYVVTTVILTNRSEYKFIRCEELSLGWYSHVCLGYKILSVEDADKRVKQNSSAVILLLHIGGAFSVGFIKGLVPISESTPKEPTKRDWNIWEMTTED